MIKKILLTLIILSVIGCELLKEGAKISGSILNATSDTIEIEGINFSQKIALKEGTFEKILKLPYSGLYMLHYQDDTRFVYLDNSFNLKFKSDAKDFYSTFEFEGKGSVENNYLVEKSKVIKEVYGDLSNREQVETLYKKDEDDFLKTHLIYREKILKLLDGKDFIYDDFVELEKADIDFHIHQINSRYPRYHAMFNDLDDFEVSDDFNQLSDDFDYENESFYKFSFSYRNIVFNHFVSMMYEDLNEDETPISKSIRVLENLKSSMIRSELVNGLYDNLSPSIENLENVVEKYISFSQNDNTKQQIKEKYNLLKELVKGQPSPKFSFQDVNGDIVSSKDLIGKYAYIDVWATWCGPCIAEIPSLKEVINEFKDDNINFVGISVDVQKNKDNWAQMVKEKNLYGYQLLADKDWNSDFVVGFDINSIPRFILLDPQGNIVSADAPRPSNPKLKDLLTSLLKNDE